MRLGGRPTGTWVLAVIAVFSIGTILSHYVAAVVTLRHIGFPFATNGAASNNTLTSVTLYPSHHVRLRLLGEWTRLLRLLHRQHLRHSKHDSRAALMLLAASAGDLRACNGTAGSLGASSGAENASDPLLALNPNHGQVFDPHLADHASSAQEGTYADALLVEQLANLTAAIDSVVDIDRLSRDLSAELGGAVQRHLRWLQFERGCDRLLTCELNKACGFGCQMHHVARCLAVAVATNRTLVLGTTDWSYGRGGMGFEANFLPVTNCSLPSPLGQGWSPDLEVSGKHRVLFMDIIDFHTTPYDPPAMPPDLFDQVHVFSQRPEIWWLGQLVSFLLRPSPAMEEVLRMREEELKLARPVVGIHVRRTDKITAMEALSHDVSRYMDQVEAYYDRLESEGARDGGEPRRVFVASDEPKVLEELLARYPNYTVYAIRDHAQSADVDQRFNDVSLKGIFGDIWLLSRTDYLVCTMSSQVCRLAVELMAPLHVDASQLYTTLDDPWYFGGQQRNWMCVMQPWREEGGLDVQVGDMFGTFDSFLTESGDLYLDGILERTGRNGRVPTAILHRCAQSSFPRLWGR